MFNKEAKKIVEDLTNISNIIGKGTTVEGNIESQGNVRIEGKVIGNINTKSKLVMSETAQVEGNIIAQNAEIAGLIKGKIEVADLLVLKVSATINGDILTAKLAVEPGANFNGICKMSTTENPKSTVATNTKVEA